MFFFSSRRTKGTKREEKAEAIKKTILTNMDEASELIAETSKLFADPTLKIYYATRRKGQK